jgi:hypothetical protein
MDQHDQQTKISFSRKAAWLGLAAYILLVLVVVVVYCFG